MMQFQIDINDVTNLYKTIGITTDKVKLQREVLCLRKNKYGVPIPEVIRFPCPPIKSASHSGSLNPKSPPKVELVLKLISHFLFNH